MLLRKDEQTSSSCGRISYQLSVEILNQKQRKNEPPLSVPKVSYYHNEILGPASSKADSGSKEHHPREIILTATNEMTTS